MIAAVGSFFEQEFNISYIYGAVLITILCFITFKKNIEGLTKINVLLVPVLVVAILVLGFKSSNIKLNEIPVINNNWWLFKSILYSSYNSIILIPIIISLNKKIKEKTKIYQISVITFIIMLLMSFSLYSMIQTNLDVSKQVEIPIIYLARQYGILYKNIYSFVVLIAIFTTAISSGYSFLNNCTKNKKQYTILACIISILAIIFSSLGFEKLLNLLYPILGFLGLIQIFFVLKT